MNAGFAVVRLCRPCSGFRRQSLPETPNLEPETRNTKTRQRETRKRTSYASSRYSRDLMCLRSASSFFFSSWAARRSPPSRSAW